MQSVLFPISGWLRRSNITFLRLWIQSFFNK